MPDEPAAGEPLAGRPTLRAGAVVTRRNDLLVVRRASGPIEGRWSIPTAAVRRGDTLVESAVRAVVEGTGLDALGGPFLGWYESIDGADDHDVVMCFSAVVLDDGDPVGGPGIAEARWMPVWEFSELPTVEGLADLLADHGVIDTLT